MLENKGAYIWEAFTRGRLYSRFQGILIFSDKNVFGKFDENFAW